MFSNVLAIITQIKADLTAPVTALLPGVEIHLDEEIDLVYDDLPALAIYPTEERNDEEFQNDFATCPFKKDLFLRIELRVKGTPASQLCTPALVAIVEALQADPRLGGLIDSIEAGTVTWATGHIGSGLVSGACLELIVRYITQG